MLLVLRALLMRQHSGLLLVYACSHGGSLPCGRQRHTCRGLLPLLQMAPRLRGCVAGIRLPVQLPGLLLLLLLCTIHLLMVHITWLMCCGCSGWELLLLLLHLLYIPAHWQERQSALVAGGGSSS